MIKFLSGAFVTIFGGGGKKVEKNVQDDPKAAEAAFVERCEREHGYTPVKMPDGGYAHPTWVASMRRLEQERAVRRSR